MKWTRKTKEFQYAPYISECGKYRIEDINDCKTIPKWEELKKHNWDSKETHEALLQYAKENKIKLNGSNWAVVDNITNEIIKFPFATVKKAKEYVESNLEK